MDVIPAVPPSGTGLDAVAEIARRRAGGWAEFTRFFAVPTIDWIHDLREGDVRRRLETAIGWRAGELTQFGPPMLTFGVFERSARRRDIEEDLARLTTTHAAMAAVDRLDQAGGACELLTRLSTDEAVAWSAGSLPRARDLRLQQSRELRSEAGESVLRATEEAAQSRPRQPYLALAQMCGLWVEQERAGSPFAGGS